MDDLQAQLLELQTRLSSETRGRWQRSLPFTEMLFDRWKRAAELGFGEGASIYQESYVFGDVKVGDKTWVGPFTMLDGSGGLRIGKNCSISTGVQIYTHDTVAWAVSGGRQSTAKAPVSIGNCCYIGSQTVIAKGVTIGDHCVIGACSFVNRDIPPFSVAVGVPCRVIGRVIIDAEGAVKLDYFKSTDTQIDELVSDTGT